MVIFSIRKGKRRESEQIANSAVTREGIWIRAFASTARSGQTSIAGNCARMDIGNSIRRVLGISSMQ